MYRLVKTLVLLFMCFGTASARTVPQLVSAMDSLIALEKWQEAEECIVSAMKQEPAHPRNVMLFFNLGVCQYNQGKFDEAVSSFDIVLARNPDFINGLYRRSLACVATGDTNAALNDLDRVLQLDPTNLDSIYLRSLILFNMGKHDAAAKDMEELLSLYRRVDTLVEMPADIHILAARIARSGGNTEEARSHYEIALSADPTLEVYSEVITFYLTDSSESQRAQTLINEALKKFPTAGELYLFQAVINKRNFQNTEADTNLKIAKKYGVDIQTIEFFFKENRDFQ